MSNNSNAPNPLPTPVRRVQYNDTPSIVGARWWNDSVDVSSGVDRRAALGAIGGLGAILAVGAALTVVGVGAAVVASSDDDDEKEVQKDALDLQRQYGWDFAAGGANLTFDGVSTSAFDRARLASMATELAPSPRLRPYFTPTLFQSLTSTPSEPDPSRTTAFVPLRDAIQPISTPAMDRSYAQGAALASLFDGVPADTAIIVDLPGPEAVAFAAGMAERFEPVFTFDNWPHPQGVVGSHQTLAAAAYYQPLFARTAGTRGALAAPVFVLDRNRLTPYTDDSSKFDNRYVARVPGADQLKALGIKNVLYVWGGYGPGQELDDLNADFVAYEAAGVDVKLLDQADLRPSDRAYYYGGSPDSHFSFWSLYGWHPPPRPFKATATGVSDGYKYQPLARATVFGSAGSTSGLGMNKAKPPGIGAVWVLAAVATGKILGPATGRLGSWGRAPSGWSGG